MDEKNNKDKKKIVTESIGDKPVNSRIYIDYEQTPPKISFDYPDTNINQIKYSSITMLVAMAISLIMLMFLMACWIFYIDGVVFPNSYDSNITNVTILYHMTNYSDPTTRDGINGVWIDYVWNGESRYSIIHFYRNGKFWYYPSFSEGEEEISKTILVTIIPAIIAYSLFFILCYLNLKWVVLLFTKTKWGHKAFPEINKRFHGKGYSAEFLPEDMDKLGYIKLKPITSAVDYIMEGDRWLIELPMFRNMYMDYEASEDFSKYLTKISIVEHPFSRYVKKKGKYMTKTIKKVRKTAKHSSELDKYYEKKTNIYLWKAVFEFKQKPETGSLRIWFT